MAHLNILETWRFAQLPPTFQSSYQNGIEIAAIEPQRKFKSEAAGVHLFFTHSGSLLTREIFKAASLKTAIHLSQTSQFFYRLFNEMFPKLEMRLSNPSVLNELALSLHRLEKDQCINLLGLDLNLNEINFASLKAILEHTPLLRTLNMPYIDDEKAMGGLKKWLGINNRLLKDLHFTTPHTPTGNTAPNTHHKVEEIINTIALEQKIPVYIDHKISKTTYNQISAFNTRHNAIIFWTVIATSVALNLFLAIEYGISVELLILVEFGVIASTFMILIAITLLKNRCAKKQTFYPDYEALN